MRQDSPSRLLVLGANGPTGRRTVRQALDRGLEVVALTRHPDDFPIPSQPGLRIEPGDATDPGTVDAAVAGCDAVVSVIGSRYTRQPVHVYSESARLVTAAMERQGRRRLVVVTSSGVTPPAHRRQVSGFDRLFYRVARRTYGRTVYDDMDRMEEIVSGTDLDWTIVRPPGLTDEPGTGYATADTWVSGSYCARDDLASMLLDQLQDRRSVRGVVAVATPGLKVKTLQTIRRELLKR